MPIHLFQVLFSRHALTLGAKTVWLVKIFIFLMFPVAYTMSLVLDKLLGEEFQALRSKKEIEEIIKELGKGDDADLDKGEERILLGALSFSDAAVKKMSPETVLFTLEKKTIVDRAKMLEIQDMAFTGIPVYDSKEDYMLGVLYAKDLIGLFDETKTIADLLTDRKPIPVNDTMLLNDLMNHFIK